MDYRKSVSDSMNTTKLDSSVTLDNKKSLLKEDTEWDVRYTGSLKTTGKFKSFKYQNYSPRVISTRFLDARGREISGKIGKGQIINVEIKVANGGDYSFPAHLKLDKSLVNKIEPLPWKEQGAIQDGKPISVTEEENMNTYKGLSVSVKPMGSNKKGCAVITYKAKITGDLYVPGGEDVSVIGQIVTDVTSNACVSELEFSRDRKK